MVPKHICTICGCCVWVCRQYHALQVIQCPELVRLLLGQSSPRAPDRLQRIRQTQEGRRLLQRQGGTSAVNGGGSLQVGLGHSNPRAESICLEMQHAFRLRADVGAGVVQKQHLAVDFHGGASLKSVQQTTLDTFGLGTRLKLVGLRQQVQVRQGEHDGQASSGGHHRGEKHQPVLPAMGPLLISCRPKDQKYCIEP